LAILVALVHLDVSLDFWESPKALALGPKHFANFAEVLVDAVQGSQTSVSLDLDHGVLLVGVLLHLDELEDLVVLQHVVGRLPTCDAASGRHLLSLVGKVLLLLQSPLLFLQITNGGYGFVCLLLVGLATFLMFSLRFRHFHVADSTRHLQASTLKHLCRLDYLMPREDLAHSLDKLFTVGDYLLLFVQLQIAVCLRVLDLLRKSLHRLLILRCLAVALIFQFLLCVLDLPLVDGAEDGVIDRSRDLQVRCISRRNQFWEPSLD